ncbi:hypothetical protein GCM10027359_21250 [Marilutibacter aestuarii]
MRSLPAGWAPIQRAEMIPYRIAMTAQPSAMVKPYCSSMNPSPDNEWTYVEFRMLGLEFSALRERLSAAGGGNGPTIAQVGRRALPRGRRYGAKASARGRDPTFRRLLRA